MSKNLPVKTGSELQDALRHAAETATPKLREIARFAVREPESFARMSSREICAQLGTSEPTLIRFCRQFGHGGLAEFRIELLLALAAQQPGMAFTPTANDRRRVNRAAKRMIARAALPLIQHDRSLLIDNGSTAETFAAMLDNSDPKTIMTNGLLVAQNALLGDQHKVMLTGGEINPASGSLGGRQVEAAIATMHFETFLMGVDSLHLTHGVSTHSDAEAHVTRAMLAQAGRVILLADHTKFRRPSLHHICDLEDIDVVVTDLPLSDDQHQTLTEHGIKLVIADPDQHSDNGQQFEDAQP